MENPDTVSLLSLSRGYPQKIQEEALFDMSFPHSGHFIKAIKIAPFLKYSHLNLGCSKKCAADAAHEKRTAPFAATQTSAPSTGMRKRTYIFT